MINVSRNVDVFHLCSLLQWWNIYIFIVDYANLLPKSESWGLFPSELRNCFYFSPWYLTSKSNLHSVSTFMLIFLSHGWYALLNPWILCVIHSSICNNWFVSLYSEEGLAIYYLLLGKRKDSFQDNSKLCSDRGGKRKNKMSYAMVLFLMGRELCFLISWSIL